MARISIDGGSDATSEVMMDTPTESARTPPYMSFETLKNFLLRLNPDDLPPRIDRSMMVGMSGGAQTTTLSTLREFGMVQGEGNAKTEVLDRFVRATEEELVALFGDLVRSYYAEELKLSATNGTAAQLDELFTNAYGVTGSTRRKAVTFFLHAAKFGKVTLSPHFKAPRAAMVAKRTTRPKASPAARPVAPPPPADAVPTSKTISLPGATVTLSYTADLFELSTEDRTFILDLVDKLKNYEASSALPVADTEGQEEDVA